MDEFKTIDFGDVGVLPDALRTKLKRRRGVRRVRQFAGSAMIVALCAAAGVYMTQPIKQTPSTAGWHAGAVITLDDPMFDILDEVNGDQRVDTRWRAGAWLDGDWALEM
jgi:hypothetical protein